jgi:hypothetical protein
VKRALLVIGALLVSLLGYAGTASAATFQNCNGKTVISAQYIKSSSGSKYGSIQLCRDGGSYFGMYISYRHDGSDQQGPLPSGVLGNAFIYRYVNGQYQGRLSCDDTSYGGNEHLVAGDTMCVTGRYAYTGGQQTYRAYGLTYWWTGQWTQGAEGHTARCTAVVPTSCVP